MNNIPDFNSITIADYKPEIYTLSNGIKVYCFNNSDMEVVFMKFIFYNAGTINQDKFFVSTLTKTQLNQGTKDYSSLQLAYNFDFFGVNYTQTTSNEQTTLTFSFLKQYQKDVFKSIEQIIKYPTFPDDRLKITINDYKQEFLTKCQQTSFLARRSFMANLFGEDSIYGKYGKIEDYDKVKTDDLKRFYQQRYSSNQCYIMLSGNVDKEFVELLDKYIGQDNWNENTAQITTNNISIKQQKQNQTIITHQDKAVQASIVMGKFFPEIKHKDYISLNILNCVLGGYFNSRLMSNIREEKGYTYGIDSVIVPIKNGSVFMILTDVMKDKDEDTIKNIYYEMDNLCKEEIREEELNTVKHYMIGDMLRNMDGVIDICESYENIVRFSLKDTYNSEIINRIKTITSKELKDLANEYFKKESFLISIAKNAQK